MGFVVSGSRRERLEVWASPCGTLKSKHNMVMFLKFRRNIPRFRNLHKSRSLRLLPPLSSKHVSPELKCQIPRLGITEYAQLIQTSVAVKDGTDELWKTFWGRNFPPISTSHMYGWGGKWDDPLIALILIRSSTSKVCLASGRFLQSRLRKEGSTFRWHGAAFWGFLFSPFLPILNGDKVKMRLGTIQDMKSSFQDGH